MTFKIEARCKPQSKLQAWVIVVPGAGIKPGMVEVPGKCLENKRSEATSGAPGCSSSRSFIHSMLTDTTWAKPYAGHRGYAVVGGMSLASGALPAPGETQENPPFQRGPDQLSGECGKMSRKR